LLTTFTARRILEDTAMTCHSYVAEGCVDGERRFYTGASPHVHERVERFNFGLSGAYLRPKGAAAPTPPVVLLDAYLRAHDLREHALLEEVLDFALLRLRGERVRGGPYSNVKWTDGQKSEVKRLEDAVRPFMENRPLARGAIIELAASVTCLRLHLQDRCFKCRQSGHYEKRCPGVVPDPVAVVRPPKPKAKAAFTKPDSCKKKVKWDGVKKAWKYKDKNGKSGQRVVVEIDGEFHVQAGTTKWADQFGSSPIFEDAVQMAMELAIAEAREVQKRGVKGPDS